MATFEVVRATIGPDSMKVVLSTHRDRTVAVLAAQAAGAKGDPVDFQGKRVIFWGSSDDKVAIYVDTAP